MNQALQIFRNILSHHKLKLLSIALFAAFFYVVRFPFDDLGDFVSAKITELTSGQVSVQFAHLGISLIPQPGIELSEVFIETAQMPALKMSALSIAPSITGLLTFKPGVSAHASGFLGGSASVVTRGGKTTETGLTLQKVSLSLEEISLKDLRKMLNLPVNISGELDFQAKADIDPSMTEQPLGEIEIVGEKLLLESGAIPTAMGPLTLPEIKISRLNSTLRLGEGQMTITESVVGADSDPIQGRFKGNLELRLIQQGQSVQARMSSIDLKLDLKVDKNFFKQNSPMFLLLTPCKNETPQHVQLLCQLNISQLGAPPRVTPLAAFR